MSDLMMTIGGEAAPTAVDLRRDQPGHGRGVRAGARSARAEQLDAAFEAAGEGVPRLARRRGGPPRRAAAAADALMARGRRASAPILTAEQGKPLGEASIEVLGAAIWLPYYANLEIPREVIQDDDSAFVEVVRRPLGVVAAITPWNFPLMLASWKIAPALLAGNTVVLKPSPFTPLATLKLGELLREVLPAGRAQRRQRRRQPRRVDDRAPGAPQGQLHGLGRPPARRWPRGGARPQAGHARARRQRRGDRPRRRRSGRGRREDLRARPSPTTARSARPSSGSTCPRRSTTTWSRRSPSGPRASRSATAPTEGTELGPDQQPAAVRPRAASWSPTPSTAAATAAAGGQAEPGDGYFFEPTILTGVTDGTRIVDEEQFGPALPVISYRDVDDAVARANATNFGLCGSVWGGDAGPRRRGRRAGSSAAPSWVNTHLAARPAPAVRRGQVERHRRGERPLGPLRLHRAQGGVPGQVAQRTCPPSDRRGPAASRGRAPCPLEGVARSVHRRRARRGRRAHRRHGRVPERAGLPAVLQVAGRGGHPGRGAERLPLRRQRRHGRGGEPPRGVAVGPCVGDPPVRRADRHGSFARPGRRVPRRGTRPGAGLRDRTMAHPGGSAGPAGSGR